MQTECAVISSPACIRQLFEARKVLLMFLGSRSSEHWPGDISCAKRTHFLKREEFISTKEAYSEYVSRVLLVSLMNGGTSKRVASVQRRKERAHEC